MVRRSVLAAVSVFLFLAAPALQSQTQQVLHTFTGPDGAFPDGGLTADGQGKFYGTTQGGGLFGDGTVFQLTSDGSGGWNESVIYNFCSALNCTDGFDPYYSNVSIDAAGNLYGTTCGGGSAKGGTVWQLSPMGQTWVETVLYSFDDAASDSCPINGVLIDSVGNLYGTTYSNGTYKVFGLSKSSGVWNESVIYSFPGDGGSEHNGLVLDSHGNIFGNSLLTVFKLSPDGNGGWTSTVIHSFGTNFARSPIPTGNPVFDSAGNLYGVTYMGGAYGTGSVYKISPRKKGSLWTFKTIYALNGCPHHLGGPVAGVIVDSSGNVYGTTPLGGSSCVGSNQGYGTVFELTPPVDTGSYTGKVLWNFAATDGANPYGSLVLGSDGNLYGMTENGGSSGDGLVFEIVP